MRSKATLLLLLVVALVLTLPVGSDAQARVGAWVDAVLAVEEPSDAAAVSRLEANDIQVWFSGTSNPEQRNRIQRSPGLANAVSYGLYTELTFNPVGPVFPNTQRLNPFSVARIREAVNWLADRRHIAQEIMGGMATPRYLPISTVFPDYARMADVARRLEIRYAPNPERARAVISEEMGKLGATLVGGKWQYQGQPVTLIFLIRTEDERRQIGDYLAGLLESVGFTVTRRYGRSAELAPLWIGGDPAAGQWHAYTGGWITTLIDRDESSNFDFFYTARGLTDPLWQAYKPSPAFDKLAERLGQSDYTSVADRTKLFAQALELSMQDSVRVWLVSRLSVWPRRKEVRLVADLASGYSGSRLWPYTLRFEGRTGGTIRMGLPSIITNPWNPIGGSNWIFDQTLIRATQDWASIPDPFTGLYWPQRVERAEVTAKEGLPITKSLDWVTLRTAPKIRVPNDAIISWDPRAQQFITVRQKHPQGLEALTRTVVYYEKDLFKKAQWHDGSLLSMGDLMIGLALGFDRSMEGSPIYDPATVPAFESFVETFRGLRVVSENPLVVEYYTDNWTMDAEVVAAGAAGALWPNYGFGPGAWHNLAIGIRAEAARDAAFSSAKARRNNVEWLNYVAGPTLAILDRHLQAARSENYIPYAPALSRWIKPEEARQRYTFLTHWRQGRGHFWVGLGPFQIQRVSPVEKIVELRRFGRFPDPSTKWVRFDEPRLASVSVSGPSSLKVGSEGAFDVKITFRGRPYSPADIEEVKYLLFDAKSQLVTGGPAARAGDAWKVTLSSQVTRRLAPGSNRLEVIVVSKVVSIPSFASASFTTLP
jgi:peptide/nickel transport system substrate-binding protein